MDARLNYMDSAVAARFAKYLQSAGKVVADSGLPAATRHLVEIRASQINGNQPPEGTRRSAPS